MNHPTLKLVAAAVLSAGFGLTAVAQTTSPSGTPSGATTGSAAGPGAGRTAAKESQLNRSDRRFIENAAQGGLAEVELGKLAAQKAQSPDVKQFGERMVQDHGKANQQLMQIAQQKGVNVPTALDGKHKRLHDKLSKAAPDKFDREYMDAMEDDHKKDVKDFREASKDAKDPDVKAFATQTLPVLEEHHKMAQSLHEKVKDMEKSARASGSTAAGRSPSGGTRTAPQ